MKTYRVDYRLIGRDGMVKFKPESTVLVEGRDEEHAEGNFIENEFPYVSGDREWNSIVEERRNSCNILSIEEEVG
jgi:hypothetical protein